MKTEVDVQVRQITWTPESGALEVYYEIVIENTTFSGGIAAGKTSVSAESTVLLAEELTTSVLAAIKADLGLENNEDLESSLLDDDTEDPL